MGTGNKQPKPRSKHFGDALAGLRDVETREALFESTRKNINSSLARMSSPFKDLALKISSERTVPLTANPVYTGDTDFIAGYSGQNDELRLEYVKRLPDPIEYNLAGSEGMSPRRRRMLEKENEDRRVSVELRKKLEARSEGLMDEVHHAWRKGPNIESIKVETIDAQQKEPRKSLYVEIRRDSQGNPSTRAFYYTRKPELADKSDQIHEAGGFTDDERIQRGVTAEGADTVWYLKHAIQPKQIKAMLSRF